MSILVVLCDELCDENPTVVGYNPAVGPACSESDDEASAAADVYLRELSFDSQKCYRCGGYDVKYYKGTGLTRWCSG